MKINKEDLLFYLEEMISMGLSDEIEDELYEDIKWFGKCKKSQVKIVVSRINQLNKEV